MKLGLSFDSTSLRKEEFVPPSDEHRNSSIPDCTFNLFVHAYFTDTLECKMNIF